VVSLLRHKDFCLPPVLTRAHRILLIYRGLTRKLLGFDLGLIRAMDRNEMREIAQLHDLNQSIWLDNVTRGLRIGQTHRPRIDNLAITFTPAATQIGWDGESL